MINKLIICSMAFFSFFNVTAQTLKKVRIIDHGKVLKTDAESFCIGENQKIYVFGAMDAGIQVSDLSGNLLSTPFSLVSAAYGCAADMAGNIYTSGTVEIAKYNALGKIVWQKSAPSIRDITFYKDEVYVLRQCHVEVRNPADGALLRTIQLPCSSNPLKPDSVMAQTVNFEIDPMGNFCVNAGGMIKVYNKNGNYVGTTVTTPSIGEFCIAPSGDYILTKVGTTNEIFIYDWQGNFKTSFGKLGIFRGCFKNPYYVKCDNFGSIYVLNNGMIQQFDANGNFITCFGKPGHHLNNFLLEPENLIIDHRGYMYLTDYLYAPGGGYSNYMQVLDAQANLVGYIPLAYQYSTFVFNKFDTTLYAHRPGYFDFIDIHTGTIVDTKTINSGNAINGAGTVRDIEFLTKEILVWNSGIGARGKSVLKKLELTGFNQYESILSVGNSTSDGAFGDGYFAAPMAIAVSPSGNFFLSDVMYDNIQVYDKEGNFILRDKYYDHGNKGLNGPMDMVFGAHNYLYVCDKGNNRIVVLDSNLNYVSVYSEKQSGKDDALWRPQKVVYANGNLYVLDKGNGRIHELNMDMNDTSGRAFKRNMYGNNNLSMQSNISNIRLNVYPNPSAGKITIQSPQEISEIEIIDIMGKSLFHSFSNEKTIETDISAFASGFYTIRVITNNETINARIIKN